MKLEFFVCGSPNAAFYSQAAMFRLALDSFGGDFARARLVLCLGAHERQPLPARWEPHFRAIEVQWAPVDSFLEHGDGSYHVYDLVDPGADLSFVCDADTLPLRPLPADFLAGLLAEPAIAGVLAHRMPPRHDAKGRDLRHLDVRGFWAHLGREVTGAEPDLHYELPLPLPPQRHLDPSPFYLNYGFIAATPALFRALHEQLDIVQPRVREVLDNDFYMQLAIPMAVQRGALPTRVLPMRYNFPNDPLADAAYPDELAQVVVVHYLRTERFDRHRIFATAQAFNAFLALQLSGSDAVFQGFVRGLTGGRYPFA
jgi:hypothetical protein